MGAVGRQTGTPKGCYNLEARPPERPQKGWEKNGDINGLCPLLRLTCASPDCAEGGLNHLQRLQL